MMAMPNESIMAIDGLHYGFVSDELIDKHFRKTGTIKDKSFVAGFNYFLQLTSDTNKALRKLLHEEQNLINELTHLAVFHYNEKIFESYDNFSINICYTNIFSQSDLNHFRSKGIDLELKSK